MTIAVRGTRAQSATAAGASSSYSVTRTDCTKGDVIVLWLIQDANNKKTFTVTDDNSGGSNVYKQFGTDIDDTTDGGSQTMWLALAQTTQSLTITVTYSGTMAINAMWAELVSGSAALPPSGAYAGQLQNSASTSANAVTTTNAQPDKFYAAWLLLAIGSNESSGEVPAAGTGFTSNGTGWNFGGADSARSESKRVTSSAAVAGTFTATHTDNWINQLIILSEASGDSLFFGCGSTS